MSNFIQFTTSGQKLVNCIAAGSIILFCAKAKYAQI